MPFPHVRRTLLMRVNRCVKTSPNELFIERLKQHSDFEMLYGWIIHSATEEYDFRTNKINRGTSRVRNYKKNVETRHFLYRKPGTDGYALINLPTMIAKMRNLVFLKTIFVEEKYSGNGIATACMDELKKLTLEIDKQAEDDETLSFRSCSLYCVPNSFWVSHWTEDNIQEIDWTSDKQVDGNLLDETEAEMDEDKIRMTWEQLRDWYIKLGFVEVRELMYYEYLDTSNTYQWRLVRQQCYSNRSIRLKRFPLLFPAENAGLHRGKADGIEDT